MQRYFDEMEQRRTGNPAAHSCRKAAPLHQHYDISGCSLDQIAAEMGEEDFEHSAGTRIKYMNLAKKGQ